MSLINNALKKAQRQRSEGAVSAPMPGGTAHRQNRHGKTMPAQSLLLIVAGACVVVALSVAVTVYFLRTPTHTESIARLTADQSTAATSIAPPPQPTPAPLVATPAPSPAATIEVATEEPVIVDQTEIEPEPVQQEDVQPLPQPEPPPQTIRPDVKIYTYLDQLQVMGVRYSGASSKVLMNDNVYRVNDIVDRALGLRLTEVTPNSLTFVDPDGASYIKNF